MIAAWPRFGEHHGSQDNAEEQQHGRDHRREWVPRVPETRRGIAAMRISVATFCMGLRH
jgi:hypothetical protein